MSGNAINNNEMTGWQVTNDNGIKRFGPAFLYKKKGIFILHVEGTDYQMGYQHGKLLKDEIESTTFAFFEKYIENIIAHSEFGVKPWLLKMAMKFVNFFVVRRQMIHCPEKSLETYHGIADALNKPFKWMRKIIPVIDSAQYLAGMNYGNKKGYSRITAPGCTCFVAGGEATSDNHVIGGFNKDYEGMEYVDKNPTLIFCTPDNGMKYMLFSSPGQITPALGSVNEAGLTISVQTLMTKDVGIKGVPLLVYGIDMIKTAKTVNDAIEYLKSTPTQVGWKFIIADKNGDGAIVEKTNKDTFVVPMENNTLGTGNLHEHPDAAVRELNLCPSMMNNFIARQKRMKDILKENYSNIDIEKGAAFLGDHHDIFTDSKRSTGNVIAQMSNIISFMVDLTDMNVWIGQGPAPVCDTVYRGFSFEEGFKENSHPEIKDITSPNDNSDIYKGLRHYILGSNAHSVHHDIPASLDYLKKAIEMDKDEILYKQLAGIVSMQLGDYKTGEHNFRESLEMQGEPNKKHLAWLWIARALDLQNNRTEALIAYRTLTAFPENEVDIRLLNAAKKGLTKPYKSKKLSALSLSFWLGDTLEY